VPPEPREIGSEFHWDATVLRRGDPHARDDRLPERHELFATGCGALAVLLRRLAPRGRVHVPTFFCTGVAQALSAGLSLAWYRHLPDGRGPRLDTLRAVPGDVVLAQNLFGRDDMEPWQAWMPAHPGVTVVEDHSHDPFGAWARASIAPYAVASLRKTLPVPDGGLLWSPRGLTLPRPEGPESPGAALKLAAMLLKSAWLHGRAVPKDEFRALQQCGEQSLLGSTGPASAFTRAVLPLLDLAGLRQLDARNAAELTALLPARTAHWRVLRGTFRVQLLCTSQAVRDALLGHLARQGIFAPVHWRQDRSGFWSGDAEAAGLGERILTLPVDHRCEQADVRRMAAVVQEFAALPAAHAAA
jgi:hypothetical protein